MQADGISDSPIEVVKVANLQFQAKLTRVASSIPEHVHITKCSLCATHVWPFCFPTCPHTRNLGSGAARWLLCVLVTPFFRDRVMLILNGPEFYLENPVGESKKLPGQQYLAINIQLS